MPSKSFSVPKFSPRFGASVPVASHTRSPALDLSDGVVTEAIFRTKHRLVCDATGFRVVYANVVNNTITLADQITVQASLDTTEYSTPIAFTFNGRASMTLDPGGVAVSDPLDLRLLAGASFFVRTYVTVASGDKHPRNLRLSEAGEGADSGSGSLAKLLTGTVTANTSDNGYGPAMILALPAPGQYPVIVGAPGDSTVESADTASAGFIQRAFNSAAFQSGAPLAAIVQTSLGGDGMISLTQGNGWFHWSLLEVCTHLINHYGINDINGSASLATMQARMISVWRNCRDRGIIPFQTTVGPSGNITGGKETVRTNLGLWLRAGAPMNASDQPLTIGANGALLAGDGTHLLPSGGVIDTAAVLDANSALLDDGTHPTPAGHIAMAAVIDLAAFGL